GLPRLARRAQRRLRSRRDDGMGRPHPRHAAGRRQARRLPAAPRAPGERLSKGGAWHDGGEEEGGYEEEGWEDPDESEGQDPDDGATHEAMSPGEALAFVERHGVVLQAARGPVPSLAEAVAGGPIRGSWWGHPRGHEIFRAAEAVTESPDVLVCKLVDGKGTYGHRRLWGAPL